MKPMTDVLYAATRLVTESRHGSPSMIVRCLKQHGVRVTHDTAVNLLDQMHEAGIVGPARGSYARDVLMDTEAAENALLATHGGDWTYPKPSHKSLWGVLHPESGSILPTTESSARHLVACNDDRRLVARETPGSDWREVATA